MQKTVIVGSKNPTKIQAVRNVFPELELSSREVPSKVSAQPFSDEETRIGAVNRAKACAAGSADAIGIGLEGGVMYVAIHYFSVTGERWLQRMAHYILPVVQGLPSQKKLRKHLKKPGN